MALIEIPRKRYLAQVDVDLQAIDATDPYRHSIAHVSRTLVDPAQLSFEPGKGSIMLDAQDEPRAGTGNGAGKIVLRKLRLALWVLFVPTVGIREIDDEIAEYAADVNYVMDRLEDGANGHPDADGDTCLETLFIGMDTMQMPSPRLVGGLLNYDVLLRTTRGQV